MSEWTVPFRPEDFPVESQEDARALWAWFDQIGAANLTPFQAREALEEPEAVGIDRSVFSAAARVAYDEDLLLGRLRAIAAADRLPDSQKELYERCDRLVGDHARLLAPLAGLKGSWQKDAAARLAAGFALAASAINAGQSGGMLLVPASELRRVGIAEEAWAQAERKPDGARNVLWKQAIRARDALAAGREAIEDLPRSMRRRGRRYWLGALELMIEAERQEFDGWSRAVRLRRANRWRIRLQALVGKTAFGSR